MPHRLIDALNYNEEKVKTGKAVCLSAANYLKDADKLNFQQKLHGFERLNELNDRATTKTLHVSLNFDPSEKLDDRKLETIATSYMEKIGFGQQPYLIYKHKDAGHPHIHIVSNTIREDGTRINTHNIGRNQSEKARKEIEKEHGLVRAEQQKSLLHTLVVQVVAEKVVYGKTETKKSISSVVRAVLNTYRFTSLPEYNAVLKQYNVTADRGSEEGRMYKHRGLAYRILDADGNKIGVPVKASSISTKPTLDTLEKRFIVNATARDPFKQRLKETLDTVLSTAPGSMKGFVNGLSTNDVYTVVRQNTEGRIYGITFVDNKNRCVFNGSDLGKQYSASAIQAKLASPLNQLQDSKYTIESENKANIAAETQATTLSNGTGVKVQEKQEIRIKDGDLLNVLLSPKEDFGNTPFQLLNKKRKKKRKNSDNN